jgi:hypothetical protein
MYDARIFISDLNTVKEALVKNKAIYRGEYVIHDSIFELKNSDMGIDKVFMRLRSVPVNIWDEKPFIVVVKQTELKRIGKQSIIPFKEQFDTEQQAKDFINKNYLNKFKFLYEFDRMGWQFDMGDDQIDLEDIEGLYSVEFKSKTETGLRNLLKKFDINLETVIKSPSVVEIKKLLKR